MIETIAIFTLAKYQNSPHSEGGLGGEGIKRRRGSDVDEIECLCRHNIILGLFCNGRSLILGRGIKHELVCLFDLD